MICTRELIVRHNRPVYSVVRHVSKFISLDRFPGFTCRYRPSVTSLCHLTVFVSVAQEKEEEETKELEEFKKYSVDVQNVFYLTL